MESLFGDFGLRALPSPTRSGSFDLHYSFFRAILVWVLCPELDRRYVATCGESVVPMSDHRPFWRAQASPGLRGFMRAMSDLDRREGSIRPAVDPRKRQPKPGPLGKCPHNERGSKLPPDAALCNEEATFPEGVRRTARTPWQAGRYLVRGLAQGQCDCAWRVPPYTRYRR
jgi:hypothetical protein